MTTTDLQTVQALKRLVKAGATVLADLNARIKAAEGGAVPMFRGIAELHTELNRSRALIEQMQRTPAKQPDASHVASAEASPVGALRSGWQAIETAPKGRTVLAGYWNKCNRWRTVTACYYLPQTLQMEDDRDDLDDDGYAPEGWYEESDTHDSILPTDAPPTHWMPLPAPPEHGATSDDRQADRPNEMNPVSSPIPQAAPTSASAEGWTHVNEALPPCDGETVFLGENSAGYLCTFNRMNPDGCCLQGSAEACTAQFSELRWWRVADRPSQARAALSTGGAPEGEAPLAHNGPGSTE